MKDFNDIIKNKLQNYQEAPAPELLDNIRNSYPKKSFNDVLKTKTSIIISSVIVVSTSILLLTTNNNKAIQTKINEQEITQNINPIQNVTEINEVSEIENIQSSNEDNKTITIQKYVYQHKNIFEIRDTAVCGNLLSLNNSNIDKNLILPQNINFNNNKLSSSKPGKYLIKYQEGENNTIYTDSMFVEFKETHIPEILLSSDILCYNQELKININNNYNDITWDAGAASVKKINKNEYILSGFQEGKNNIYLTFNDNNCKIKEEKQVNVKNKIKYSYTKTPNFCAENNANVQIKTINYNPEYYIIDNNSINKTGTFKNLSSGLHILQIKYNNNCYVTDTIFILDSLKLNPYFKSERDLINKNKFNFNNLTKVDNYGFEQYNDLKFSWKVNNNEISTSDNFSYEFTQNNNYKVELIASLNNNCWKSYSETIIIDNNLLKIPNLFTPNGDGIGDFFEVKYDDELLKYHILITTPAGEKIFESNNIDKPWDGKIFGNNDARDGNYYYIINAEDKNGNKIKQDGMLQLIRR